MCEGKFPLLLGMTLTFLSSGLDLLNAGITGVYHYNIIVDYRCTTIFSLCSSGDQTQGFDSARQVFYYLSYTGSFKSSAVRNTNWEIRSQQNL